MMGSDGQRHVFSVQMPAARHCRREERLTQLFRILNSVLQRRKESRRRNLQFHLPTAVALAPQLRLTDTDSSYMSLQDIYDRYCRENGRSRETSGLMFHDRVGELHDPSMTRVSGSGAIADQTDQRFLQLKAEVFEEIQAKMDPETIMTNVSATRVGLG
jgi:transformation/transcription domain-associated protein